MATRQIATIAGAAVVLLVVALVLAFIGIGIGAGIEALARIGGLFPILGSVIGAGVGIRLFIKAYQEV